jgi:hypothetical protein
VYVVLFELRPTLDSLDVRLPQGVEPAQALTGPVDLQVDGETVERLMPTKTSAPATDCTVMKTAGGDINQEFCPVSRGNGSAELRSWQFRNRMFLLVTNTPPVSPLPRTIPWAARLTLPPVALGSGWTVFEL